MRWSAAVSLLVSSLAARAATSPLSITLETSWPSPPLALEILETAYDEFPSSYFPLLRLLAAHLPALGASPSPETILTTARNLLSSHSILTGPSASATFDLGLALHVAAPKIEAYYNYYASSVDEVARGVESCESWVDWRGKAFCAVDDLRRDIELSIDEGVHHLAPRPDLLPFDHLSPADAEPSQAVFYFTPGSQSSAELLDYLHLHATQYPNFQYIVRYRAPLSRGTDEAVSFTPLAGYGVEMALKKTDYLVVDDRATSGGSKQTSFQAPQANYSEGADYFASILGADPWEQLSTPITPAELKDIPLRAASLVMQSPDQLEALIHLSQDLPKYTAALARKVEVKPEIRRKAQRMKERGPAGPVMFLNGKQLQETDMNAYSLLKKARDERNLVLALTSLGLTPKQGFQLISDPVIGQAQTEGDALEGLVDASDRIERAKIITYWNDIEKDSKYQKWPAQLQGYLRQVYPGQMHNVRFNTWNVILVLDLSYASSLETIANPISMMIKRGVPLRFGIVPMFSDIDSLSAKMARLFFYMVKTFGRAGTRSFFAEVAVMSGVSNAPIDLRLVAASYARLQAASGTESLPFEEVIASSSNEKKMNSTLAYLRRLAATPEHSSTGHLFINGKHAAFNTNLWTSIVQTELAPQLNHLQEVIASGYPVKGKELSTYFYDRPSTTSSRNTIIVPSPGGNRLQTFNLFDVFAEDQAKLFSSDFVYSRNVERGAPLTIWVIGDLDSEEGTRVVLDALQHLQTEECASRLGFIHLPSSESRHTRISTLIHQYMAKSSLSLTEPGKLEGLIKALHSAKPETEGLKDEEEECSTGKACFKLLDMTREDRTAASLFWRQGQAIAQKLGIDDTQPRFLVNGRLVGPITTLNFQASDFDGLELYELRTRVKPVIDLLSAMFNDVTAFDRPTLAHLIAFSSSVVASVYKPEGAEGIFVPLPTARTRAYQLIDDGTMSFTIGDAETALLHVAVVVDPVSEQAQKWSALAKMLSSLEHVFVTVYLDPVPDATELKVKRFYRSSLPSTLAFDVDGNIASPAVTFHDLPSTPIFTLAMDTPPSWVVSPTESPLDLDNLLLGNMHDPIHVSFTLKQLVIDGHARESTNSPPRGLQLQLTAGDKVVSDTQVMANLGYLQFKATPGVYNLEIRPGRGREVFDLESVGSNDVATKSGETETTVVLNSFNGVTIYPGVKRKEGMESADVLQEDTPAPPGLSVNSVLNRMKSMVGLAPEVVPTKSRHADINIFTVASGLLYERFASIMILSVMKHTKSTVKFWFIENFLSPTFLEFLPHFSKAYGFEYEVVTYKWPSWLRAQTEKQRIIWAYKILFLDVLFPMDLDKVIFVDADQIVRVDMKELVNVDLKGHVYGYPPMGNSREEMEGFRFWKTGYWKDALRGRPYHISALYVVDLKKFRQVAAGDRLRGNYHALSADPNSLANLDQDLPNSMQDQIPIFTLDQDWLWCQTWCSDESLASAKTIDLCQNPLTKEPKLVRARQIEEWDGYDKEVARFAASLGGKEGRSLAADVDKLASGPVVPVEVEEVGQVEVEEGQGEGVLEESQEENGRISDEL